MAKLRTDLITKELKKRAVAATAPTRTFSLEDYCFDKQLAFIQDSARFKTAVCSRRAGKCRPAGSLIKTPTGSVPIEQLKVGDLVYGYNSDGTVSLTTVTAVWDQGIKEVVDLIHNSHIVASSTLDHKWLAHNTYENTRAVKPLKKFNSRDKIAVEYVAIPGGNIVMPYAYTLGVILGDGCSRESGLIISGQDVEILDAVAGELKTSWRHSGQVNYSNYFKGANKLSIPHYKDWAHNKYAHEKTCDLATIRTWTRQSQLNFIAGLIDTDGSVTTVNNRLVIRLHMQAKKVIETVQALLLDLFQVHSKIYIDSRAKYKNGPVYNLTIGRNIDSKRVLKELPTKVVRKQWTSEYELYPENNTSEKFTGFKIANRRFEQCYDITVDNDTHLFLDANGMIGHNTIACAADLLVTALSVPGDVAYITLSRRNAKRIIWRELLKLNKEYALGGKIDGTELTIQMPNGNIIHVSGAKDEAEIERFRGMSLRKVYIDEAQSFRPYIKELIEDVIEPALSDYYGTLVLIGTPGPIPAGFFYETSTGAGWSHHHWTMQDNPHIKLKSGKEPLEIIKELAERRGLSVSSPSILREYFGQWVKDAHSLVYNFDPARNIYYDLPNDMRFVFGVDIGWKDADAIAVLGYSESQRKVYLVEEYIRSKNDITSLVEQIKSMRDKYDPVKIVMDAGALGRKIQEEIRQRHGLHVEAAEKTRKSEFIALLNDDLRTGRLLAPKQSRFEEDSYLVQWDYSNPERPVISTGYHTDIGDAVLYAWRECKHFYEQAVKPPLPTQSEHMRLLEEREAEEMEAQKRGGNGFTDVNSYNDLFISDDDFFDDF